MRRRPAEAIQDAVAHAVAGGPGRGEITAGLELLARFRQSVSVEERQLAEWRSDGVP